MRSGRATSSNILVVFEAALVVTFAYSRTEEQTAGGTIGKGLGVGRQHRRRGDYESESVIAIAATTGFDGFFGGWRIDWANRNRPNKVRSEKRLILSEATNSL